MGHPMATHYIVTSGDMIRGTHYMVTSGDTQGMRGGPLAEGVGCLAVREGGVLRRLELRMLGPIARSAS